MDAIAMLKDDNKSVENLFKEFSEADFDAYGRKRQIFNEVLKALTAYAYVEERVLYPAAQMAMPEFEDHVLEGIEEHHVVAWLLDELSKTAAEDERFDAKMSVLMENVRHHIRQEEDEWLPEIRDGMDRKELQELGDRMAEARRRAPKDPLALSSARL
jgi:hemerythrin superfamily protein